MAKHKSAIKRHRQSLKRQARNVTLRSRLRTLVKKARTALDGTDVTAAQAPVADASKALGKAASKGLIHRNSAARKISRLAKRMSAKQTAPASS